LGEVSNDSPCFGIDLGKAVQKPSRLLRSPNWGNWSCDSGGSKPALCSLWVKMTIIIIKMIIILFNIDYYYIIIINIFKFIIIMMMMMTTTMRMTMTMVMIMMQQPQGISP
jgi:hypothetical protein